MAIEGFNQFPDSLQEVSRVTVECEQTVHSPDACDVWSKTVAIDADDILMDTCGYLHFEGVPSECLFCENDISLKYNDVMVVNPK